MTMHTIEQFTLTNIGTTAGLTKYEYCNINDKGFSKIAKFQ